MTSCAWAFWSISPSWGDSRRRSTRRPRFGGALLAEVELLEGAVDGLHQLDDAVALLAIVALHYATPSAHIRRNQPAICQRQHPVRPSRERPVVSHDDHPHLEVPRQLGEELVQPLRVCMVEVPRRLIC